MLANLIKALQTTGLDPDEEDGGLMNVVAAMMEQLSNKEMLYEPMKELDAKFGPWLVENKGKGKFSDEEMERFEKQATIASQIVAKFEEPGYTDEDAKCREYVWGKMQEVCDPFRSGSVGLCLLIWCRCKLPEVHRKNSSRIRLGKTSKVPEVCRCRIVPSNKDLV